MLRDGLDFQLLCVSLLNKMQGKQTHHSDISDDDFDKIPSLQIPQNSPGPSQK